MPSRQVITCWAARANELAKMSRAGKKGRVSHQAIKGGRASQGPRGGEEQTVPEEPEAKQPESVEQPQEAPEEKEDLDEEQFVESFEEGDKKRKVKKDPYTIGGSGTRVFFLSSGSDTGDAKKVCLVGDDSDFQKYLDDGYEVTLVQATEQGHVKITTALEWPSVSSKHSVTARYIPQEIKERCDVNYEDLGLEDRTDGEASLSSSGSSFHFSLSAGSGGSTTTSDIRKRVFGHLCNQPFFRNYAMLDECKDHEDIEDEDNYPWG
ncbi:hypothetical protein BSKO_00207 [Bryopsis sp. KO-2023]|nr:hypothetical protein BSKO_00207 [Bryopsis sp. KO-2023]